MDHEGVQHIDLLPGGQQREVKLSVLHNPQDGLLQRVSHWWSVGMKVALALLQVSHGLALDLDGQDGVSFSVVSMQRGIFQGIEAEPHIPSCLRIDVQHPLESVGLTNKEG